jgi:hypothetical protein
VDGFPSKIYIDNKIIIKIKKMKQEKQSILEVILVAIIAVLISYYFYLLAGYYSQRIKILENDSMRIQEELLQIKAKVYNLENNK